MSDHQLNKLKVVRLKALEQSLLTKNLRAFLEYLHVHFESERQDLLKNRKIEQEEIIKGKKYCFREETQTIRESSWQVKEAPKDLQDRRVEITGPPDRKMMIHAMNSGAKVFMADLEDSCSPHWKNILEGHDNLSKLVHRKIDFTAENGKEYKLARNLATLVVRPRGWHLVEEHFKLEGKSISASLFDFALYLFHNHNELCQSGSGVYYYLPKLENHHEARLWAKVFEASEKYLGLSQHSIKATVLIETIGAAFDMEEILWELRDFIVGMNAGRWDYIFSVIKKFHHSSEFILPNRSQVSMKAPFMRAYCDFLVDVCHKRGAHAIGGMSAFIPSRKHQDITSKAVKEVREDKEREAEDGFDGTWVAHPDLVPVAMKVFDHVLAEKPNQKHFRKSLAHLSEKSLLQTKIRNSFISEEGLRANIRVALQYLQKWLSGLGAVAIDHMMEDAATAEISRAQIWQWLHHKVCFEDGRTMTKNLYEQNKLSELKKLKEDSLESKVDYGDAVSLLDHLVLQDHFEEFLTVPAAKLLASYEL